MKRKDFIKRMNWAELLLGDYHEVKRLGPDYTPTYEGVCCCISKAFNYDIGTYRVFERLMGPNLDYNTNDAYWLGDTERINISIRKLFLRMFERICLDEKLYEGF